MAGPCTLLAQPHYNRYIDAEGEHEMPWNDASPAAALPYTLRDLAWDYTFEASGVPAALSAHVGFSQPSTNLVAPSSLLSYSSTSGLTTANCTVTLHVTPYLFQESWQGPADFDPEASQAFFAIQGFMDIFGFYVYSDYNYGYSAKLTATGANLTATRPTLAGKGAQGTIFIILFNGAATPRTIQMIRGGANFGAPRVIPALSFATIGTGDYSGFTAAQAVGFKVTDSVAGDKIILGWIGCSDRADGTGLYPVPFRASDVSTDIVEDLNGYLPITPWAGTPIQSKATEGERFWRVPIKRHHIAALKGTIASRFLPFGWPDGPMTGAFTLSRFGNMAYTYSSPYTGIGVYGQRPSSISQWDSPVSEPGIAWSLVWESAYPTLSGVTIRDYVAAGIAEPTPWPLESPPSQFSTVILSYDDDGHVLISMDDALLWDAKRGGLNSIATEDFPFHGVDPEGDPDPLYLAGVIPPGNWEPSVTYHRDLAIFNRPLTVAESAFVNDPDSVWSFNMFSEPATATVTGFEAPIYRGDNRKVSIVVKDSDGVAVPLHGCSVWLTAKSADKMGDTSDASASIRLNSVIGVDGVAISSLGSLSSIDAENGKVTFDVMFDMPRAFRDRPSAVLEYDIQFLGVNGTTSTIGRGTIIIVRDITRS